MDKNNKHTIINVVLLMIEIALLLPIGVILLILAIKIHNILTGLFAGFFFYNVLIDAISIWGLSNNS